MGKNKQPYTVYLYDSDDLLTYAIKLWSVRSQAAEKAVRFLSTHYHWRSNYITEGDLADLTGSNLWNEFEEMHLLCIAKGHTNFVEMAAARVHEVKE